MVVLTMGNAISHKAQARWDRRQRRRRVASGRPSSVEEVARALKLQLQTGGDGRVTMTGRRRGCDVRIVEVAEGRADGGSDWYVEVASDKIPSDVNLTTETRLRRWGKWVVGEDVLTGDRAFDELVHVRGPEADVVALLDEGTRNALKPWIKRGLEVRAKSIRGRLGDLSVMVWPRYLRSILKLASRIAWFTDGEFDAVDKEERLRRRVSKLAHSAMRDRSSGARLRATQLLDDLSEQRFKSLRSRLAIDPLVHAWLLMRDGKSASASDWQPLDEAASHHDCPAKLRTFALKHLLEAPLKERSASVVLGLIEVASDDAERVRFARRLGEIGGVEAVEPLVELQAGLFRSAALKDTARRAVAAIQRRTGTETAGGLTVHSMGLRGEGTGDVEGALSEVVVADDGGLSSSD